VSPDATERDPMDHLWNAAHEFLQAMRKLVDAADEFVKDQRDETKSGEREPHVHHIDIDNP